MEIYFYFYFYFSQHLSQVKVKRDRPSYERMRQFIPDPQDEQDYFYNSVLHELYEVHHGHMNDKPFTQTRTPS